MKTISNPLRTKINLNGSYTFSPYRAVNTVNAYRKIIAVCSDVHTEHKNALTGKDV